MDHSEVMAVNCLGFGDSYIGNKTHTIRHFKDRGLSVSVMVQSVVQVLQEPARSAATDPPTCVMRGLESSPRENPAFTQNRLRSLDGYLGCPLLKVGAGVIVSNCGCMWQGTGLARQKRWDLI